MEFVTSTAWYIQLQIRLNIHGHMTLLEKDQFIQNVVNWFWKSRENWRKIHILFQRLKSNASLWSLIVEELTEETILRADLIYYNLKSRQHTRTIEVMASPWSIHPALTDMLNIETRESHGQHVHSWTIAAIHWEKCTQRTGELKRRQWWEEFLPYPGRLQTLSELNKSSKEVSRLKERVGQEQKYFR